MANKRGREPSADGTDIDKIRAEIEQEKQMSLMLENSMQELETTMEELEKRYDCILDEGNEWKTKFETQEELNALLEKQFLFLKDKLEKAKESAKDGFSDELKAFDELSEASLRKMVKELEREKNSLNSQLKDYNWRLDQESKAFHKANEARKNFVTELRNARLEEDKFKQSQKKGSNMSTPRDSYNSTPASRRLGRNVPDNQRIIDPRRGPIRKTAAVKKLPKLDTA
ncbi:coiled-coil domain-containing protein 169-like [Lytechinus variegatus]|uniref:coiled-coil domain-containing protein 169-like n=1 Tax=Lytechinus variegatus TaxID=7654 RepID=UPI001BB1418B|nr:coiled-coil domain-containing protein 169-like [Lytechinus variegatus]